MASETFESECKKHGLTQFFTRSDGKGRCKKCASEAVMKCRKTAKQKLVELFGGCCKKCGYNRCQEALQFHHLDPKTKSFTIAHKGKCRDWQVMVAEAEKCILLCANCHAEAHCGLIDVGLV